MKLTQEQVFQRHGEDIDHLMSSERGRRVMWNLLGTSGVFRISYEKGDPTHTAFREGQRAVGSQLLADIQRVCPEKYNLMQVEAKPHE